MTAHTLAMVESAEQHDQSIGKHHGLCAKVACLGSTNEMPVESRNPGLGGLVASCTISVCPWYDAKWRGVHP